MYIVADQRIMRGKKTEKKGMKDIERTNQATSDRGAIHSKANAVKS